MTTVEVEGGTGSELVRVRSALDGLAEVRFGRDLSREEAALYQQLCRREAQLLGLP